jgi:hypothetical protein
MTALDQPPPLRRLSRFGRYSNRHVLFFNWGSLKFASRAKSSHQLQILAGKTASTFRRQVVCQPLQQPLAVGCPGLPFLLALADPGDEHQKAPEWCRQVGQKGTIEERHFTFCKSRGAVFRFGGCFHRSSASTSPTGFPPQWDLFLLDRNSNGASRSSPSRRS